MIKNKLFKLTLLKASILMMLVFCSVCPVKGQVVSNLSEVNTPFDEQHPLLSPSGNLYFTIALHPENVNGVRDFGDVWISTSNGGKDFLKPSRINDLSTSGYDVVVGFLHENSLLVYHDGKEKEQGIHQYSGSGNSWNHDKQLKLGSFKNQSTHFSGRLSPSGDILILSLASFGSYGNEDIYVSFLRENGNWSTPQNLGPDINTYQQEMTPFLSGDNRLLFFSSNGHGSMGGVNIFYSEKLDETWEKWSVPQPLSTGNTIGAELAYMQLPNDPERALFTTTQNSEGYGDIRIVQDKSVLLIEKERIVEFKEKSEDLVVIPQSKTGDSTVTQLSKPPESEITSEIPMTEGNSPNGNRLIDSTEVGGEKAVVDPPFIGEDNKRLDFDLKVLDINTLSEIDFAVTLADYSGSKAEKMQGNTDQNRFAIDVSRFKEIIITSTGYLPLTLQVDQSEDFANPILLTPATKGISMVLEQVLFKRGTAELLNENTSTFLSSLADFLKENPGIKILLEGHTDNLGNVLLNKELSLDRASSIRKSLVNQGVDFERIRIAGWGGSKPIASNQDEGGRSKNRRVEMVIVDQ